VTTLFHPKYRISELLGQQGGKQIVDAVKDAERGVGSLAMACIAVVDGALVRIDAARAALPDAFDEASLTTLYEATNELIGIAATARMATMDKAAYSLCDLIELIRAGRQWDREAIDVHIDALRFFRRYELTGRESEMQAVLAGLRQVCARVREASETLPDLKG
jgi:hypothetical protein